MSLLTACTCLCAGNQFHHFEVEAETSDPAYVKEVHEFLTSSDCATAFEAMEFELIRRLKILRPNFVPNEGKRDLSKIDQNASEALYIYLAADNPQVKHALFQRLANNSIISQYSPYFLRINLPKVVHIKDSVKFKEDNGTAIVNLVFDWYCITCFKHMNHAVH